MKNLWSKIEVCKVETPSVILKSQIEHLEAQTNEKLTGRCSLVKSDSIGGFFVWSFCIICVPINYAFEVLRVTHDVNIWPAKIEVLHNKYQYDSPNKESFIDSLSRIFNEHQIVTAINNLIALSTQ